jgi:OmpA-OmpF porin, OOP family
VNDKRISRGFEGASKPSESQPTKPNKTMKTMMKSPGIRLTILTVLLMAVSCAQIDVAGKVKSQVSQRVNNNVDQGISRGLDAAEGGITELFHPKEVSDTAKKIVSEPTGKVATKIDEEPKGKSNLESYSKFDFMPGEKVIFFEDFSQDSIGDFPVLWNTNGSGEVVTTNLLPGRWLRLEGEGAIWTDQLLTLPENYTIEFDIIPCENEEGAMSGYDFRLMQSIHEKSYDHGSVPGKAGFLFSCEYSGRPTYRTWINGPEGEGLGLDGTLDDEKFYQKSHEKYRISIWVQKSRIRLYQNEVKLIDLPRAFTPKGISLDRLRFEEGHALISNIRIAAGMPDLRNKLLTEGKLITYGIYFDVNKDMVKPESYATLKEIAKILNEIPEVKVQIEGHTDSDGDDKANLDLSKRRAESVKAALVNQFGVKADRLEIKGMGESKPIAPNTNPSNKALNRRVEFIKL